MDLDGGGWTYVARGSYSSDGCTDQAFGTVSTDPESNTRWSVGNDVMNAIAFPDEAIYAEYLVFIGHNTDNGYTAAEMFRKSRILASPGIDMSAPMDVTFGVDTWYGNGWVAEYDDCNSGDCGPCWEPNDVNFCCTLDSSTNVLNSCDLAENDKEGQWSNTNTNQHLRCDQDGRFLRRY